MNRLDSTRQAPRPSSGSFRFTGWVCLAGAAAVETLTGISAVRVLGLETGVWLPSSAELMALSQIYIVEQDGAVARQTNERILGIPAMTQQDAMAPLMFDCFTNTPNYTPYFLLPSNIPLTEGVTSTAELSPKARYWARKVQQMDLSRPDHPLLQRILREAPGTLQHSLQVANLAEQAAERIGADTLPAEDSPDAALVVMTGKESAAPVRVEEALGDRAQVVV